MNEISSQQKLASLRQEFATFRQDLAAALIERDEEIDLTLDALIAGQHILFVGPPGAAKSMLADAIVDWINGRSFSYLLTKFTTPEEIFGPVSLEGLKRDEYRRLTAGKLPEAQIAFLDEIFKASSSILNTMLQVLNERSFTNGPAKLAVPLELCVAASNEWPQGLELGALFDRFLVRKSVQYIATASGRERLFWGGVGSVALSGHLDAAGLLAARTAARALPWGDEAKEALYSVLRELNREGIYPGDRRCKLSLLLAQSRAWLDGAAEVEPSHLEPLAHSLWVEPREQPDKTAEVVGRIANPVGMAVRQRLGEAAEIIRSVGMGKGQDAKRFFEEAGAACAKLNEIAKALKAIGGAKAKDAAAYVTEEAKKIRVAVAEQM